MRVVLVVGLKFIWILPSTLGLFAQDKPYNVLLLLIDDTSPIYNSVYQESGVHTPNLERLADQSTWFTHGYTYPGCCISRTAFLTGLRPSTTGVYYNGQNFRQVEGWVSKVESLPARFKRAGYLTAGYGKIFHNRYQEWDEHSWSKGYVVPYSNEAEKELLDHIIPGTKTEIPDGPGNYTWGVLPDDWDREDTSKMSQDRRNAKRAVDFLSEDHSAPFFLAFGCWRPHVHWTVPKRYYDSYPLENIEIPVGFRGDDLEDIPKPGRWIATHRGFHDKMVTNALWKKALQGLFASTSYADEQIGRVLNALENSLYADNTIVVFAGDNGWHTGQKNHWSKFVLWELGTRVPYSIRVPEMNPQVSNTPVSLLDLYPTLLSLTGLSRPETHELEGIDLTPVLNGSTSDRGSPVVLSYGWQNHAVRDDRFRYIRYRNGDEELYDHSNDPHEWVNLAANQKYQSIKDRLSEYFPTLNEEEVPMVGSDINVFLPKAFE